MRETLLFRIYDRPAGNEPGVVDYVFEVAIPGRYESHIVGASQVELGTKLIKTFGEIFALLGIPQNIERAINELGENVQTNVVFTDSNGAPIPISGFAATGKLALEAEVYRDGEVVPTES